MEDSVRTRPPVQAAAASGPKVSAWEPLAVQDELFLRSEHAHPHMHVGATLLLRAERPVRHDVPVHANDHRGHGKSISDTSPPGHFADHHSWNRIVADAHGVNREIARRHPGLPIIVLGHSMGSFVLQQMLFEHPGDMVAAALSGSNGKPPAISAAGKIVARIERARVGRRNPSHLHTRLSFGGYNKAFAPARTDSDWLSRDPAEVDKYIADPLLGFEMSTQMWVDLLSGLDWIARTDNVARVPKGMPLYLFAGDRDPVGEFGRGMKRLHDAYTRAGIADVRLKLYPGGRHDGFNETNRQGRLDDELAAQRGQVQLRDDRLLDKGR